MGKITLDYIINKVDDMKALPTIITKITFLTEDPDSTVEDLEREILKDQALTSKILRLANSAYYSYARKISTISQATILLGFQTIKSMALASSISGYLSSELKGYALDTNELWRQSQSCALISRYLGKYVKYPNPEEAYIAGLLRDLGKTILNEYMEKEYKEVLDLVEEKQISFLDAEREILGFNHAEVGKRIGEKWNLPEALVDAIGHHHNPELSQVNLPLVSIVHLADAITMMLGLGLGLDGLAYNLSSLAIETLGLSDEDFNNIISDLIDLLSDEDSFLPE